MFFKRGEKPPLEHQFWKIKENPFILRKRVRLSTTSEQDNTST
jgi:hypothetical protein